MAVVSIAGLFEAHLTFSDLDRSVAFCRDVLEMAHTVPERHAAFLWVGGPGAAMLGLWSVHSSPLFMRLHVAFRVALPQIEAAVPALRGGHQPSPRRRWAGDRRAGRDRVDAGRKRVLRRPGRALAGVPVYVAGHPAP